MAPESRGPVRIDATAASGAGPDPGLGGSSAGRGEVDGCGMLRLLMLLLGCLLASAGRAQERHAQVELDSGEILVGRVLAMDLATLQIEVGTEVRTLSAGSIKTCRFETTTVPAEGVGDSLPVRAESPAPAVAETSKPAPRITWSGPLPDPVDPEAAETVPIDLRHRSLWRARLEAIDEAYPWLSPTVPSQWISLGLLLAVSMSLVVYLSVRVAGAEGAGLGASLVLALWYLVTTVVQVATVSVNDASVTLMLLANPAFALFGMSAMFGLPRSGAVIAYAIQLGFLVLGYGVLELINSLLASIGATA